MEHDSEADNPNSHKLVGAREAIEVRCASLLFLRPYSPDLDPTEQALAKLKRSFARPPAHSRALCGTTCNSIGRFSRAECRNYFVHAGYGQSA